MYEGYSTEFLNFLREARERNQPRLRSADAQAGEASKDCYSYLSEKQKLVPMSDWQRIFAHEEESEGVRPQRGGSVNTVKQVSLSHRRRRYERSSSAKTEAAASRPDNGGWVTAPSTSSEANIEQSSREVSHSDREPRPDTGSVGHIDAGNDGSKIGELQHSEKASMQPCINVNCVGSRAAAARKPTDAICQRADLDMQQKSQSDRRTVDAGTIEQLSHSSQQTSLKETTNQSFLRRSSLLASGKDHFRQHHSACLYERVNYGGSTGHDPKAVSDQPIEKVAVACQTSGKAGLGQTDEDLSSECQRTDESLFKDRPEASRKLNRCIRQHNPTNDRTENYNHKTRSRGQDARSGVTLDSDRQIQDNDTRSGVAFDSHQRICSEACEPSASDHHCDNSSGEGAPVRRRANSSGRVSTVNVWPTQQPHNEACCSNFAQEQAPHRTCSTQSCEQPEQRTEPRRRRTSSLPRAIDQPPADAYLVDGPDSTNFERYLHMACARAPLVPALNSWPMQPLLKNPCIACPIAPTLAMPMVNGIPRCGCTACFYEGYYRPAMLPY